MLTLPQTPENWTSLMAISLLYPAGEPFTTTHAHTQPISPSIPSSIDLPFSPCPSHPPPLQPLLSCSADRDSSRLQQAHGHTTRHWKPPPSLSPRLEVCFTHSITGTTFMWWRGSTVTPQLAMSLVHFAH